MYRFRRTAYPNTLCKKKVIVTGGSAQGDGLFLPRLREDDDASRHACEMPRSLRNRSVPAWGSVFPTVQNQLWKNASAPIPSSHWRVMWCIQAAIKLYLDKLGDVLSNRPFEIPLQWRLSSFRSSHIYLSQFR